MSSLNSSLPKLTGAPGFASRAVSRKPSEFYTPTSPPWAELDHSPSTLKLTKILHAIRISIIQEEVAALDSPVYLKAESQTRILDQVRIYLLSDGLGPRREHPWSQGWHPSGLKNSHQPNILTLTKHAAFFATFPTLIFPVLSSSQILGSFELVIPSQEQG